MGQRLDAGISFSGWDATDPAWVLSNFIHVLELINAIYGVEKKGKTHQVTRLT